MTGPWTCTEKEYFDSDFLSRSKLWDFRKSVPEFHARYIAKTAPPKEPSEEMILGKIAHAELLTGDFSEFEYLPDYNLSKQSDREDKKRFIADHPNKICIKRDVMFFGMQLAKRLHAHDLASKLFAKRRHVEQAWRWKDEFGNEWCCKDDFITTLDGMNIICDVKFCRDISQQGFARDIAERGYHWQSAIYIDGIGRFEKIDAFAHLLIYNKEESFGDDVAVRFIGDKTLKYAREQIPVWSERYANCRATDTWPSRNEAATMTDMAQWGFYQE